MTTKTDTDQQRADFEAAYAKAFPLSSGRPGKFDRDPNGDYEDAQVLVGFRMYQAGRPVLQSQDREDAEITAYALPGGISIERCMQRDGGFLWAVRDFSKHCLSKSGEWDYEPLPNSRTEEWLDQHRFSSAREAIDHARRIDGEGNG